MCYDDFDDLTIPANFLWTLTFLKQHSTEEVSATRDEVHEHDFRYWAWRTLTAISNTEFASVAHDRGTSVLTIFRLILTTDAQIATENLC